MHVAEANWLYAVGRVKPGVNIGSLQAKMSTTLRVWLGTQESYTQNGGSTVIPNFLRRSVSGW